MFRTFLMTVLAVVAIGFGVGSTADAGDSGGAVIDIPSGKLKLYSSVRVVNNCSDNLNVYALWVPADRAFNPLYLDLAQLWGKGARPVTPGPLGTSFAWLAPGDGYLWVFDGIGGDFAMVSATLTRNNTTMFHVNGPSTAPEIR